MLGDKNAAATIAVRDIKVAAKFYGDTLGLKRVQMGEDGGGLVYQSGGSQVFVYPSEYAGTNKATSATWGVGTELESIVRALKSRGVKFETYDLPGVTRNGEIHTGSNIKSAWFKDPDGNIIALVNQ